ncbi:hypothetical protein MRX96_026359 [Rhipicephalus microplus]
MESADSAENWEPAPAVEETPAAFQTHQVGTGDKADLLLHNSSVSQNIESAEAAENWEPEIVPGAPGYVPARRVTFNSLIGVTRSERRRLYKESLKQAAIHEQ